MSLPRRGSMLLFVASCMFASGMTSGCAARTASEPAGRAIECTTDAAAASADWAKCPTVGPAARTMFEALHAAGPDLAATLGPSFKLYRVVGRKIGRDGRGDWSLVGCAGFDSAAYLAGRTECRATHACGAEGCSSVRDRRPAIDSNAAILAAFPSDADATTYELSLIDDPKAFSKLSWTVMRSSTFETKNVDAITGAVVS